MDKKKLQSYLRDILFLCFIIYNAQGGLFPQGTIITQLILIFIIVVSGLYFLKTLFKKNNKNKFYFWWTALFLLNVLGYILDARKMLPSHFGMFRGVLLTLMTFYPFYDFAQQGLLRRKDLLRFFYLIFPIAISGYYFKMNQALMKKGLEEGSNIVNNASYTFVWLLPFVFLFIKRKILSFIFAFICLVFIIQGGKRGAMVTGGIALIVFTYYQLRTLSQKNRIRGYVLVLMGMIAMSYYAYDYYSNNEFLINRIEQTTEGYSSGRDVLAEKIFNGWLNSETYYHLLFGYGFAASWDFAGNYAHNDWLELLSNFGLIGVFICLMLFYTAFSYNYKQGWSKNKRILGFTIVFMWLLITLFSMGYPSNDNYLMAFLLAYLIGNNEKQLI